MIQSVHTVLVGKQVPREYTDVDALNVGDVALFDENRKLIVNPGTIIHPGSTRAFYVGVAKEKINVTMPDGSVAQKANIEFSNIIQRNINTHATSGKFVAPVEEKVSVDLAAATITTGNRYVLRIVYKDIFEDPGLFTHTYEVYATSTAATDLATAISKRVNAHKNRRVNAQVAGSTVTLTAMPKNDNEGVNSIDEYSVVSMEVSLYETKPGASLSNYPTAVNGAVITKTAGNPGKGYWKQVRDAEARNMPYKGHVLTGAYPEVEGKRNVVEGTEYDYIIIESDNYYLSNDNQYVKTTPLTTEIYVPGVVDSAVENILRLLVPAFLPVKSQLPA